ncbi:MAG: hypothetical protein PHH24_00875 [Candidatus Moranbacteria bacterium]|jgi:hypothetical protein|nr:hypothetical protein [Candidatus Moranbacteria bacterium]MDD5652262.1 hypothetical protein [Candidatus Moranbacteria bacterium]MDX9855810.1 hypothetical protein [Candidatus Moranbacteria bacterium]
MSTTEVLEVLFGSKTRARMMRFFILNPKGEYTFPEILRKNLLKSPEARKELNIFKKARFTKERKKGGKKYYFINPDFPFYKEIERLIVRSDIFPQCKSLSMIKKVGNVKLAVTTGVFLNYEKGDVDLLIVVDGVSRAKLKKMIANLEAEVGREIRYMIIDNEELTYRLNMLDRFIIDMFKGPHEIIINKAPKVKQIISRLEK